MKDLPPLILPQQGGGAGGSLTREALGRDGALPPERPPNLRRGTARWQLAAVAGVVSLVAAACSAGGGPAPQRSTSPPAHSPAPGPSPSPGLALALQVTPARCSGGVCDGLALG